MNIDEMPAGREMDMLVGQRVFGWIRVDEHAPDVQLTDVDLYIVSHYSTDIAAAWKIVTQIEARFSLDTSLTHGSLWYASFEDRGDGTWQDEVVVRAVAPTAPLAICRAALKFVEAREASDER